MGRPAGEAAPPALFLRRRLLLRAERTWPGWLEPPGEVEKDGPGAKCDVLGRWGKPVVVESSWARSGENVFETGLALKVTVRANGLDRDGSVVKDDEVAEGKSGVDSVAAGATCSPHSGAADIFCSIDIQLCCARPAEQKLDLQLMRSVDKMAGRSSKVGPKNQALFDMNLIGHSAVLTLARISCSLFTVQDIVNNFIFSSPSDFDLDLGRFHSSLGFLHYHLQNTSH